MSLEMEVLSLGSKGPLNAVEPPVPTYAGNTGVTQGEGTKVQDHRAPRAASSGACPCGRQGWALERWFRVCRLRPPP